MTMDTSVPRSRRALLAGGVGALAALAAAALGRPLPVQAADGDIVKVGGSFTGANPTSIRSEGDAIMGSSTGIYGSWRTGVTGVTAGTGVGVRGLAAAQDYGGTGVFGEGIGPGSTGIYGRGRAFAIRGECLTNDGIGVVGRAYTRTGVFGYSGDAGGYQEPPPPAPARTGVYGRATGSSTASGVHGYSPSGQGVYGQATTGLGVRGSATSGTALSGAATTGYALRTSGRLKVEKASGVATIVATKTSLVVSPGLDVTDASVVLLTPKGDIGARRLWYSTNATADTFTIRVSSPVTASLKVGWLLLG